MIENFEGHQYINLETFRKNGQGVKTPVWFVRDGSFLYAWTEAQSGKAKRIRGQGRIRVVPCKSRGEPLGEWMEAAAVADASEEALKHTTRLMKKKYGIAFWIADLFGRLRRADYTALKIRFEAE
jgi:PPOX class probable F420-dependent enzyme